MATTASATASRAGDRVGQVEDIDRIGTDRAPARFLHGRVRANQYALFPGLAVPVHALPQDARLRQPAARRHLAARPVPAQRLGADAARSAERAGAAPGDVLSRLRRVRSAAAWASSRTCAEADGRRFTRYDTTAAGQRQRRPRVRHDAVRRRQGRDRRVPEDLLTSAERDDDQRHHRRPLVQTRRCGWASLANLALALPTIAAPDMMIEFSRLPTATPRAVAAVRRPAARPPQRLLHAGRHRHRPLSHRGVARRRQPRLPASLFFVSAGGLPHARTLRPRVPGAAAAPAAGRASTAPPARWRRNPRRRGPDDSGRLGGRFWLRLAFGLLVVAGRRRRSWSTSASSARSRRRTSRPTRITSSSDRSAPRRQQGVPYWIWLVLPRVFPDLLPAPGGYASLGFLAKDGHEMPIGLSKVTVGFPRVGINCACATPPATAPRAGRAADDRRRRGRRTRPSPQQYLRFLFAAARRPALQRRHASSPRSRRNTRLSLMDRLLYRFAIIPAHAARLLRQRDSQDALDAVAARLGPRPHRSVQPGEVPASCEQPIDDTIGNSDMVPVWNLRAARRARRITGTA